MELHGGLGNRNIKEVIAVTPEIGAVLEKYGIGCSKCSIGTCLLKDVVAVHFLGAETEALIETEINLQLTNGEQQEKAELSGCSGQTTGRDTAQKSFAQ